MSTALRRAARRHEICHNIVSTIVYLCLLKQWTWIEWPIHMVPLLYLWFSCGCGCIGNTSKTLTWASNDHYILLKRHSQLLMALVDKIWWLDVCDSTKMLLLRHINFRIWKVVASDIRRRDQSDTGPWEIGADSDTSALELFSGSDCCCLGVLGCSLSTISLWSCWRRVCMCHIAESGTRWLPDLLYRSKNKWLACLE